MDLQVFHDTVRYFLNKEQGGWLSPEEIDNITDRAQMWFFNNQFEVYAKTQKIQDSLSTFSTKLNFTTASDGIITLPTNQAVNPCYEHLLSVTVSYTDSIRARFKPVKIISEDEISERLDSQILYPTIYDPVGTEVGKGKVQLYPAAVMTGYSYYLRRPLRPVFSYTQTGRTIIYDSVTSVQLEWNESSINNILIKTIQMFGVNLSDEMIISYSEQKQQQEV